MAGGGGEEAAAAAAEGTQAEAAEAAAASGSAAGASSEDADDYPVYIFPGHAAPEAHKFRFLLFAALHAVGEQFYELDDEEGCGELMDDGLDEHMDREEHLEMWYALYCTLAAELARMQLLEVPWRSWRWDSARRR